MKVLPLSPAHRPPQATTARAKETQLVASRRSADVLPFPLEPTKLVRETAALIARSNAEAVRCHGLDLNVLLALLA